MMDIRDVAIIGGGASGIMTAITAKRINPNYDLIILEGNDRILKKINATGNGRCNFTNTSVSPENYYGQNSAFADFAQFVFGSEKVIEFFSDLGIEPLIEDGKVFPRSGQASSVVDCLRFEADRLEIPVMLNFKAETIAKKKNLFYISDRNQLIIAKKLVISAGGTASKKYGTDGSGYSLLKQLGHEIIEPYPALVQLLTKNTEFYGLSGIKVGVKAEVLDRSFYGELLFTEYGLSGNVIFYLSAYGATLRNYSVLVDFLPEWDYASLYDLLLKRREKLSHLQAEHFLSGLLNKKLGMALCKLSGIQKLSLPIRDIDNKTLKNLSALIKKTVFEVNGTKGFDNAQAAFGGADTGQFNDKTMESKIHRGLYATGEVLDILGDCGGYNLQWAFASGYLCGKSL